MIEKLKENTKIKLISLLSALVLWMYVMAIVDPEETKLFEGIPVSITNMDELSNNDFVIYPEVDLTTDIYVTGKLSALQSISKDDIRVYTTINDPKKGNNGVYLRASISKGLAYEFKPDIIVIPLEKVVEEKRSIDVVVEGKYKNNLDTIQLEKDSVKISGPESLVKEVQKLQATLKLDEKKESGVQKLELSPINGSGKVVEGVIVENSSVNANISLLVEKSVPINTVFDISNENIEKYELSQSNITIKGKKDIVEGITSINTKLIDLTLIKVGEPSLIELDVPEGIKIDETTKITIKIDTIKELTRKLTYNKNDIEIRNNNNSIDISTLKIPENVEVNVESIEDISNLNKSDITLYIDLSEDNGTYQIKYDSKYEFKNITINPKDISV